MSPSSALQLRSFNFVMGPAAPRAQRFPEEKWEEHREELCSLYDVMTLDALMIHMKAQHGFAPK
jgi:hypothetical protein